jgi:hypothetical protein
VQIWKNRTEAHIRTFTKRLRATERIPVNQVLLSGRDYCRT